MVVDDDSVSLKFLGGVLESMGVGKVLLARGAQEALKLLEGYDGRVDLIVSDIEMPEMDGYEFVRRIRYGVAPKIKDVPILMVTASPCERYERKARIHKIDGYVLKTKNTEVFRLKTMEALGAC